MKKVLENLKQLIARHKLLTGICFLAAVIIIILLYVFFSMFISSNDKYGNRLNGINKVEITKKDQTEIKKFLEEKSEVSSASVRIQGKIIYIHIELNRDVSLEQAKEIANSSLEKLDDDEKNFYDIGFSLTQVKNSDEDPDGFIITGSKNAKLDHISWIKS